MARNFYSEINLHIVWHTKNSSPLLTPTIEPIVHHSLRGRCIKTPGVFLHEIGGIETLIHLCVSIVPTIPISDWIGQLKGSSSHDANQKSGHKALDWQTGYGVVSFGTKDRDWVKQYVRNQKQHHAVGTIHERLERFEFGHTPMAQAEPREAP